MAHVSLVLKSFVYVVVVAVVLLFPEILFNYVKCCRYYEIKVNSQTWDAMKYLRSINTHVQ